MRRCDAAVERNAAAMVRRALSGLSAKEWALEEELRDAARAKEQQRKRIDEAEARRAVELAGACY